MQIAALTTIPAIVYGWAVWFILMLTLFGIILTLVTDEDEDEGALVVFVFVSIAAILLAAVFLADAICSAFGIIP